MGYDTLKGFITRLQRFSVDDGPGIRTTVFLKGCSLSCRWCHNPETIKPEYQLQYAENLCVSCGLCVGVCLNRAHILSDGVHRLNQRKCARCMRCVAICPHGALTVVGNKIDVGGLMREIFRDEDFYRGSGGGVTLSGGEPLLQADFCAAVLSECKKKKLHTVLDTAGNVPWASFEAVLQDTDLVLYDLKLADAGKHSAMTGQDNTCIVDNFEQLSRHNVPVWVRVPVIAGVNDTPDDINGLIRLLRGRDNVKRIQLLPYHRYGERKYAALGMETPGPFMPPSDEAILAILQEFWAAGLQKVECDAVLR